MTPATHVTINGTETFILGMVFLTANHTLGHIQCIGADGLVKRVCTWGHGWGMGTRVRTSGDRLHFHRNGWEL